MGRLLSAFLIVVLSLVAFASLTQATSTYYVSYGINYKGPSASESYVINESATPTSNLNFSVLTLAIAGQAWNLTYSESVNSSRVFYPYVPAITNRSLSYSGHGFSVTVTLTDLGSTSILFGGKSYSGVLYSFTGKSSFNRTAFAVDGNLTAFPSGLLYSLDTSLNGTAELSATLLSTNLALADSGTQNAFVLVAVAGGVGAAAVAVIGLGLPFVRRGRARGRAQQARRDYWVD